MRAALFTHASHDAVGNPYVILGSELATLIGVEDLGGTVAQQRNR